MPITLDPLDLMVMVNSGPEPVFDSIMEDFLVNCHDELKARCNQPGCLLDFASLGQKVPWVYRLTFHTRGLVRDGDEEPRVADRFVVALRFMPDYHHRANRFEMLGLVEPRNAFHPNLAPPAVCVEIYPREPVVEICESLHRLFCWRLKQLNEGDALNKVACAYGRANHDRLQDGIDDRPLFGRNFQITLDEEEAS